MTDNQEKLIRESIVQAEKLLDAQMAVALAADSRAMTFCGLCIAGASLLLGVEGEPDIKVGMYVASVVLYVAAAVSGWRGLPVDWYATGYKPQAFASDIASDKPLPILLQEMGEQANRYIDVNSRVLEDSSKWLRRSAYLAVTAPLLGAIAQIGVWIWC